MFGACHSEGFDPPARESIWRGSRPLRVLPCLPDALCALGPVLCLDQGGTLCEAGEHAGYRSMDWLARLLACDSWALSEASAEDFEQLLLCGPLGRLGLVLLPDTDYVAWDELIALLDARLPRRPWTRESASMPLPCCFERLALDGEHLMRVRPVTMLSPCGRCRLALLRMRARSAGLA